jgi:hypothetical protein
MKMNVGVDAEIHTFLISALDGGEWSASRPAHFIPGDKVPSAYCIVGWVGLRTGLDETEKKKSCPHWVSRLMSMKHYKLTTGRENQSTWRKTCPSATS